MKETETEYVASSTKWAASADASKRSSYESFSYSDTQKLQAERMKIGLEMVYANDVYINYRKKFIAIKVDHPSVKDLRNLRLLEKQYEGDGVVKCVSPQGVIYRIPRV